MHHNLFLMWCFVRNYPHNSNYRSYIDVLHIEWLLHYWRCLFSVLELDVRYDWWVMAPNMYHSHLCILAHITWKLQVIYGCSTYRMTALLSNTFLVCLRVAWEFLLESYGSKHWSVFPWYSIVYIYCKPVCRSLFGVQLRMTTKLTYLMTIYYTPNNGFTANNVSFYKSKVGQLHYML